MNITGKLHEVFQAKNVTSSLQKREFIVEYATNASYPQYIKFELMQDNCGLIDGFAIGENIEVFFDLRGKPWTNPKGEKIYFTSLTAWKIVKAGEISGEPPSTHPDDFLMPETPGEDLPF